MKKYSEADIRILEGLEAVRKRPSMYIGSTSTEGLHHLVWELLDNAVDEVMAGFCSKIKLIYHNDHSFSVLDNGRGIPAGIHPKSKISTIDTVFTILHSGGKFNDHIYKTAGGLHGVGSSVVNALSARLIVRTKREHKVYESVYVNGGKIAQKARFISTCTDSGTEVRFYPDPKIFSDLVFHDRLICERIQETAYLFKGLEINYTNENKNKQYYFFAKNGIIEYIQKINASYNSLHDIILINGTYRNIQVEAALQYHSESDDTILSFANAIKTKDGGSHENGLRFGLLEAFNEYAKKQKKLKKNDKNFETSDIKEGLSVIISVRVGEDLIAFEGQTKNRLVTSEVYGAVKTIVKQKMGYWLEENKKEALIIIEKILLTRNTRLEAKKAREQAKKIKKNKLEKILSGKLTPCQSHDKNMIELFLVEGDSAGGSARMGRNKKFQAVLPLKGKVINAVKANLYELLKNDEINAMIAAIGSNGIGKNFDINEVKYNKVIIMTDADTDGAHIRILLLAFFYRYMRPLLEQQMVYVALPPLYKFTNTKTQEFVYVWQDVKLEKLKQQTNHYEIQRYKGLGEMNADQLWTTTMDPSTRQLVRINLNDNHITQNCVDLFMGENASKRKDWINKNVNFELEG